MSNEHNFVFHFEKFYEPSFVSRICCYASRRLCYYFILLGATALCNTVFNEMLISFHNSAPLSVLTHTYTHMWVCKCVCMCVAYKLFSAITTEDKFNIFAFTPNTSLSLSFSLALSLSLQPTLTCSFARIHLPPIATFTLRCRRFRCA